MTDATEISSHSHCLHLPLPLLKSRIRIYTLIYHCAIVFLDVIGLSISDCPFATTGDGFLSNFQNRMKKWEQVVWSSSNNVSGSLDSKQSQS